MPVSIRLLAESDVQALLDHYGRHCAESGADGDAHFLRADPSEIVTDRFNYDTLRRNYDEPSWRRWFIAIDGTAVVGHADLTGDVFRSGLHRCELAMGVERSYRRSGIGRSLLNSAVDLARGIGTIEWIDLRVHGDNAIAIDLYRSIGFEQVGMVEDRFRIGSDRIDDMLMTLRLE